MVAAFINTGYDQHCNDIVYLLFEGANKPVAATEWNTIVRLYEGTKTYVGQIVNSQAETLHEGTYIMGEFAHINKGSASLELNRFCFFIRAEGENILSLTHL